MDKLFVVEYYELLVFAVKTLQDVWSTLLANPCSKTSFLVTNLINLGMVNIIDACELCGGYSMPNVWVWTHVQMAQL